MSKLYSDYETALAQSGAHVVYVSLENSNHAGWTERALEQGMHVIVDKPAFLSAAEGRRLVALAEKKGRCLAEATVFGFHPQIEAVRAALDAAQSKVLRATAVFSFPPLDPADFRYRKDRGGGALFDVGPYAVATSRIFFGRRPKSVSCRVLTRRPDGLDTAFSMLLDYDGGGSLIGHFGFDTEYQNRLQLLGTGISIELSRAFTLPAETPNKLVVRRNNEQTELGVAPADAFGIFLERTLESIASGDWRPFTRALLEDAELLEQLRKSSGEA